jgi:anti-sigma factor RsiW
VTRDVCPEWIPLIARAGDDSLSAPERARLEQHLATCHACRLAVVDQHQVHELLAARPPDRAPLGFRSRVLASIDQEARASWWDRLDFRAWTWRLAPVTAALGVLAYAYGTSSGTELSIGDPLAAETSSATVAASLVSDDVTAGDALSLMLFADPDASLEDALKEVAQ